MKLLRVLSVVAFVRTTLCSVLTAVPAVSEFAVNAP